MNLVLVSLSQEVSFEDGSVTNFLVLRAPSGPVFRSIVTDETAKLLFDNLALLAAEGGQPGLAQPSAPARSEEEFSGSRASYQTTLEDGTVEFGGGGGEEEEATAFWPPPSPSRDNPVAAPLTYTDPDLSNQDGEVQAAAYRKAQKEQKKRINSNPMGTQNARTVAKDSAGYPIIRNNGGRDVGDVVGSLYPGTADEDGVGSI